jgi:hypothetical protein
VPFSVASPGVGSTTQRPPLRRIASGAVPGPSSLVPL